MHLLEILILKLLPIYALPARPIALCEVAALYHEAFDDAVEDRALVVEGLARFADSFLASAERAKVLGGFGDDCGRSVEELLEAVYGSGGGFRVDVLSLYYRLVSSNILDSLSRYVWHSPARKRPVQP